MLGAAEARNPSSVFEDNTWYSYLAWLIAITVNIGFLASLRKNSYEEEIYVLERK